MKDRGHTLFPFRLTSPRLMRVSAFLLLACAAVCVLLAGGSSAQQASTAALPTFTIDYSLPADIVLNRDQGLGQCHWVDPVLVSLPYVGWAYDGSETISDWSVIEPQPGVYNWSTLDNLVTRARDRGKRVWLQVMATEGMTPQWAIDAGVPIVASRGGMPVPWNPTYQRLLRRLVHNMAARYDNDPTVEAIVVTAGGCYGEMTICDEQSYGDAWEAAGYTDAVFVKAVTETLDIYLENDYAWPDGSHTHGFVNTPVVLQLGTGLYGMGTAREPVVDWAMAKYGMRVWLKFNGLGGGGVVSSIYENYNRTTRVGYEPAGPPTSLATLQAYVMQALNEHSSYLSLQDAYFYMTGEDWAAARILAARYLGAQIVFRKIEAPDPVLLGEEYLFAMEWVNRGTTPLMYGRREGIKDVATSYDLELTFINASTGVVAHQYTFTPSVPTTNWYTAQTVRIEEYIWIPSDLPAGDYDLRIALVRPDLETTDPARYFALVNADLADGLGRYAVGGITILDPGGTPETPGAPTRTPTSTRTRTLTPTLTRTQTPTLTRTPTPTLTSTPFGMPTRVPELNREAEAGVIEAPMTTGTDSTASGGAYVYTPVETVGGQVTLSFWIAEEGNYELWGSAYGPTDGSNSFWVAVDDMLDDDAALWDLPVLDRWRWGPVTSRDNAGQPVVQVYHLGVGTHTVRVRTREPGGRLDVMEWLKLGGTPTLMPSSTPSPTEPPTATLTPTPYGMPTPTPDSYQEAEAGVITEPMVIAYDASALGGQYVYSPAPYSASGSITLTLRTTAKGVFELWGRVLAETYGSDSFWVTVDGGDQAEWHIPLGDWKWEPVTHPDSDGVYQKKEYALGPGVHTVFVRTREAGTKLDAVEFRLPGGQPIATSTPGGPTATGTLRTSTPTHTPTTTPTLAGMPTATPGPFPEEAENGVIEAPMTIGYDATASGGQYVYVPREATTGVGTWGALTLTFWITASGNYELQGLVWGLENQDSFWVTVDGGDTALWDLPVVTEWVWRPVQHRDETTGDGITLGYYFGAGPHQVVINAREAGARIDKMEARGLKHGTPPAPTRTPTATQVGAPTATRTATSNPSQTPTVTRTPTTAPAQTATPTLSATRTQMPTGTVSVTPTPTVTRTATPTQVPTVTPSLTQTPTRTVTRTVTRTLTPVPTTPGTDVTITLQQGSAGYAGCEDTQIYMYAAATNYCSLDLLKVGERQRYASLLRFDVSSIPADAIVTSASLQLYAAGWGGENMDISVYQVIRPVSLCQTTWDQAQTGSNWGLAGCTGATDHASAALVTLNTTGISQWYTLNATSVVQSWVDGSQPNHGVVLHQAYPLTLATYYFASAQNALVANRPKLVVTYRAATGPTRTPTPSATPTSTPSRTPTGMATFTPAPTPTRTLTPVATSTSAITEGTIILQQGRDGYAGYEDTDIYAYDPATNYCSAGSIRVGLKQYYAAMVKFDLAPIPSNAVVRSASLEVYSVGWSGKDLTFGAYRVLRSMDPCQATWDQAANGNNWGAPGANNTTTDRAAEYESSATTNGLFQWSTFDVTDLVQDWLDGLQANNGIVLRGPLPPTVDIFYFASAQHSNSQLRPRLVVNYMVAGGPAPTRTATVTPNPTSPAATPTPTTGVPGTETTVSLQVGSNGYTGSEDTHIYIYEPGTNYCTADLIKIGERRRYAGLVRFDVSSVPANAVVSRATLQLYAYGWGGGNLPIDAFRVIRPVNLCQATWNQAGSGNPWGTVGCENTSTDRDSVALSSITTTGIGQWYAFDITSATQGWVAGSAANNGVVLQQGWPALLDSYYFASAQHSNASLHPRLVITYRVS